MASRGEGGTTSALGEPDEETSSKSVTPHSLVGVPLGVLRSGGGLALCVAAVVNGGGDASVLIGGTTVSRVASRGRAGICAAAVSAATGVLLDSRTFLLRSEADYSTAIGWLTDLPDGVVVSVAACGRASSDASLGSGLEKTLTNLVSSGCSDDAKIAETATDTKSRAWALIGWKGTGTQQWARRQYQGAENGKRCAVYAELMCNLPPLVADGASDTGTQPTQIELEGKLCLCPLNSLPAEAIIAPVEIPSLRGSVVPAPVSLRDDIIYSPARGKCHRAGESAVLVGPTVDLVDCPGWTTVLQAPGAASSGEGNQVLPPTAWTVTTIYPAVGGWHHDTEGFDDGAVG